MATLAVASGKGGTGKSSVASSLILAIGETKGLTAVDADVEEPNLGALIGIVPSKTGDVSLPIPRFDDENCERCGICARECRFNAIVQFGKILPSLNEGLCHGCGVCSMVCPHEAISIVEHQIGEISEGTRGHIRFLEGRLNVGCPNPVPVIRSVISHAKEKEGLSIVDCPPGTSCSMVEAVGQSDFVLLVTEGTPFGVADLELALEVVSDLGRPSAVVVNRCDLGGTDPGSLCRRFSVPVLARIPFALEIARSYGKGISPYIGSPLWKNHMDGLLSSLREMEVIQ